MRQCRSATRQDRFGGRRRPGYRGRLWPFAISRMGFWRRHETATHPFKPLFAAVALKTGALTLIKSSFAEAWCSKLYITNPVKPSGSRVVQIPRTDDCRLHDAERQDGVA